MLSVANILSKVLSLLYIPFLMNTIGKEGYGIYYATYNIYAFAFIIAISGTSAVIPKLMSEYNATGHYKDAMASFKIGKLMLIGMGIITMSLLFLLAKPLTVFIGYQKAYLGILALCPSIFITSINSSYRGYFQGNNDLTPFAISQFVEQLGNAIFTILFAYILMKISLEYGVAGGTFGTTMGSLFSFVYLAYKVKKDKQKNKNIVSEPRKMKDKDIFKYMVIYTAPLLVSSGLIYAGNNLIDVANIKHGLLKANFTDSLATIKYGQFANFVQILSVPSIVISSLSITILPLISKANALGDKKELGKNLKFIFKICFLISIPSAIGLAILSKGIFVLIFGYSNSEGAELMLVGSSVIIFSSAFQISNTILNSIGKVYSGTLSALTGVIMKIVSNFIFIPIAKINIYGAILGLLLTNCIPMAINSVTIKKYVNSKENYLNQWVRPLVSSIIMGIVVFVSYNLIFLALKGVLMSYIANAIAVIISVFIGAITYLKILIRIKGVSSEEILFLPYKFRKLLLISK